MEEIKYKVIAMRNQKPKENTEAVLQLYDDYIEWLADFEADEPKSEETNDHSQGWETIRAYYHIVVRRERIGSIEMEFQQTPERWKEIDKDKWGVYIITPGQSIKLWFRTHSKAQEVFNKLKDWLLKEKK
jgi:hypothetical protein